MLSIASIADRAGMSPRTVENIHAQLKKAGITQGTVGSRGGLRLALPPSEISVSGIMEAVGGEVDLFLCQGEKGNKCPNDEDCAMRAVWRDITERVQAVFEGISLGELLQIYNANVDENLDPAECLPAVR